MNTKRTAEILRVTPGTLLKLARAGLIGRQQLEVKGAPWSFAPGEIEQVLAHRYQLPATLTEAAKLYRLKMVLVQLHRGSFDFPTDLAFAPLQWEAQSLAAELRRSRNNAVIRQLRALVRQFGGGPAKVLQLDP